MADYKDKLVPQVRFKGFTDAWGQRILSDVTERITRKNANLESTLPLTISAWHGLVDQTEFFDRQIASRDVSGYFLVKNGEFAYNKSYSNGYPWGAVKRLDRYDMGVLSTLYIVFTPTDVESEFLVQYYETTNWHTEVSQIAAEGARNHGLLNIAPSDFFKTKLCLPNSKSEQAAIGNFFRTLDNALTLHKRKLDGLKALKKAYLQQMFPQAGESVPRLRFSGFTKPWEHQRLGDISLKISEKNGKREFSETLTNSAEHGIISQRDFFDKDISNEKNLDGYYIVRPDDFVYNPRISNFAPVGPIKRNLLGRIGVMSPLYYVFRITVGDLTFIEKYFESVYWHEFMKLNGDNGVRADRFNIKDSIFEEMSIPFPAIEEQVIIGVFFRNLDGQITSQQVKLDKLKQLKVAYLQKMFV